MLAEVAQELAAEVAQEQCPAHGGLGGVRWDGGEEGLVAPRVVAARLLGAPVVRCELERVLRGRRSSHGPTHHC
jgi:hypothetical protein